MGFLNVNPGDLHNVAERYVELQQRLASISPLAVEEATRISESHGPMGFPVAVGIISALARREARLASKSADFGSYAQRFNEHAATYTGQDAAGAAGFNGVQFTPPAM